MRIELPIADCRLPIARQSAVVSFDSIVNRKSEIENGFTLIEVMVVVVLLALIVLALMAVFSSTQTAFRDSVTQSDLQEGARATMDLMADDLRGLAPSDGPSNNLAGSRNFFVTNNSYPYQPLVQPLPASNAQRTNLLEWFFILGRQNMKWTGTGYIVNSGSSSPLYPLYRYYAETNIQTSPLLLFSNFNQTVYNGQWTNLSHLVDGVVDLTLRPSDGNGYWMTNTLQRMFFGGQWITNVNQNVWFSPPEWGEVGCAMFSNTLPASVQIEMGVLEDRALQRAESLGIPGQLPLSVTAESNYLAGHVGAVHVFRQRVAIPNVDPSAYQ